MIRGLCVASATLIMLGLNGCSEEDPTPEPKGGSKCHKRWVSQCNTDWVKAGALLDINVQDSATCRHICSEVAGCGFYAFTKYHQDERALCTVFSTPYKEFLETACMETGGEILSDAELAACSAPEIPCDMYRYGSCRFEGSVTESFETNLTEASCLELANINHHPGAIFNKESNKCFLYNNESVTGWQDSCLAVYGPPDKSIDECKLADAPLRNEIFYTPHTYATEGVLQSFGGCEVGLYPIEAAFFPMQDECQQWCKIIKDCKFYAFDSNGVQGKNCKLYDGQLSDTLTGCDTVAGPKGAGVPNFSPSSNTQEMLTDAECTHPGEYLEILTLSDQASAEHCSELCKYNSLCKGWVFSGHDSKCRLLDSDKRRCSVHYGGAGDEQVKESFAYPLPMAKHYSALIPPNDISPSLFSVAVCVCLAAAFVLVLLGRKSIQQPPLLG